MFIGVAHHDYVWPRPLIPLRRAILNADRPAARPGAVVLFVTDGHDADSRAAAELLSDGGAEVRILPDVYRALAEVLTAPDGSIAMVLADLRTADAVEQRFLPLIRQLCPALPCAALVLSDALDHTDQPSDEDGAWTPRQAADQLRRVVSDRAEAAAPPVGELPPDPRSPHPTRQETRSESERSNSTPEPPTASAPDAGRELALHDAVRRRMTDEAGIRVARRTPPRPAPSNPAANPTSVTPPSVLPVSPGVEDGVLPALPKQNSPPATDSSPPPPVPADLDHLLRRDSHDPGARRP